MIVGTAGHIDHGKSTLIEILTGTATDRLTEEKERGISIELGFAYLPIPATETPEKPGGDILGFVDVPGHERFVHTMVSGSTGIDYALLVVAADDGVMPQTREHVQVLDLLGLSEGVVALNKSDLVDDVRLAEVEAQIRDTLSGTTLEGIDILPVSATNSAGIADLKKRLLEEAASRPERPVTGTFRMAIDRSFSLQGSGTIVTGAVKSGRIAVGDRVLALPADREVRVRSIHAQGRKSDHGSSGQRCALNLAGIEKSALKRGDWLIQPGQDRLTNRFDASLKLLDTEGSDMSTWCPVHFHIGTSRTPARVVPLEGHSISRGTRAPVQIVLARPLPLLCGDLYVVRDASAKRTIGGGWVIDPLAPKDRRRSDARRAARDALSHPDAAEALDALLGVDPGIVDLELFAESRGLTEAELEEVLQLVEPDVFSNAGSTFAAERGKVEAIGEPITAKLAGFHADHPDLPGMPLGLVRGISESRLPERIFDAVIAQLSHLNVIAAAANFVRLPSHKSTIRAADQVLWERVSDVLEARRFQPPPLSELAEELNRPVLELRKMCKTMVRLGALVEVRKDRFFLKSALADLGEIAHDLVLENQSDSFTVGEFRDRAGCGRAIAVQVLEYFDRRGITGRRGDKRVVAKSAGKIFSDANMN